MLRCSNNTAEKKGNRIEETQHVTSQIPPNTGAGQENEGSGIKEPRGVEGGVVMFHVHQSKEIRGKLQGSI